MQYMTAAEWKKFRQWMVGQTVTGTPDGKFLTYPWDAERGIALIRAGTPTYFD
jgi:hypothetical protein